MKKTIGIFGGTFDPPHNGHVLTAAQLSKTVDLLYVNPAYNPKYKKCTEAKHRYEMCELAFENIRNLEVVEIDIQNKFQYTYQTINYLSRTFIQTVRFVIFVGEDWDVRTFKNYELFSKQCKIVAFPRPGYGLSNADIQLKISSSDIRSNLKKKLPINGLVPQKVLEYIENNDIYKKRR